MDPRANLFSDHHDLLHGSYIHSLVYSLVPRHTQYYKVMFTHLRQTQTSQYQMIFNISPHLHFRWCYLWSKTWCVWYSDIMVTIGPAYFFLSITAYPKCIVSGVGGRPLCPAHNRVLSRSSSEQAARAQTLTKRNPLTTHSPARLGETWNRGLELDAQSSF